MISPNHILNPSTPSPLPGACVPATAGTHAEFLILNMLLRCSTSRSFCSLLSLAWEGHQHTMKKKQIKDTGHNKVCVGMEYRRSKSCHVSASGDQSPSSARSGSSPLLKITSSGLLSSRPQVSTVFFACLSDYLMPRGYFNI